MIVLSKVEEGEALLVSSFSVNNVFVMGAWKGSNFAWVYKLRCILLDCLMQFRLNNGFELNYIGGNCVNLDYDSLDYSKCGISTCEKSSACLLSLFFHYDYII